MTEETRKDFEEEKLEQTYVPEEDFLTQEENSLMELAATLIKASDKVLEENKKTIENLDKKLNDIFKNPQFDDIFKDPEHNLNMIKLDVGNLTAQHKIDLAIYCFKEASKELKK